MPPLLALLRDTKLDEILLVAGVGVLGLGIWMRANLTEKKMSVEEDVKNNKYGHERARVRYTRYCVAMSVLLATGSLMLLAVLAILVEDRWN